MYLPNRLTLRAALIIDAVVSGAMGLLLLASAGPLAEPLDLPATLLRVSGAILVPFVAFLAILVARETLARAAVWTAAALNLTWVGGSIVLLVGGWLEPNGFGYAFVIVQAAAVALFAWMQIVKVVEEEARSWSGVARI